MEKITQGRTPRGFDIGEFVDFYGKKCSIQKSSIATEDCIWLGIDDAEPEIMANDAIRLGLRESHGDERDFGWVDFEIPKEVLLHTRMHLSIDQVKNLIPILQNFVDTGELY